MKRLLITEEEKNRILSLHKKTIVEQDTKTPPKEIDVNEKFKQIEIALQLQPDLLVDLVTKDALVKQLNTIRKTEGERNFECVSKQFYITKITSAKGMDTEYQWSNLRFKLDGTYYDVNNPKDIKSYYCKADSEGKNTIISTTEHNDILKDEYPKERKTTEIEVSQQTQNVEPQQKTDTTQKPSEPANVDTTQIDTTLQRPSQEVGTLSRREQRQKEREERRLERQRRKAEIEDISRQTRERIKAIRQR
jgi:hypothetical protein